MNLKRMFALFRARNLEFFRDKAALSWNFLFPFAILVGLTLSFDGQTGDKLKIGVADRTALEEAGVDLLGYEHIQLLEMDRSDGVAKVKDQRLDMFIDGDTKEYFINPNSANGYILEKALTLADRAALRKSEATGDYISYVDWVMPGVLGFNIMFSAMWGVGYVTVRYRRFGVLKRLKATPVRPLEFLAAQMLSRLWVDLIVVTILYFGLRWLVGFRMLGGFPLLLLLCGLGALCFSSIGVVVASRFKNDEVASGVLNGISFPMMIFSGVWFSLEGAHPWVLKFAQALPLTHLVEGARRIMLDGAGALDILPQISFLLITSAILMLAGALMFKWE